MSLKAPLTIAMNFASAAVLSKTQEAEAKLKTMLAAQDTVLDSEARGRKLISGLRENANSVALAPLNAQLKLVDVLKGMLQFSEAHPDQELHHEFPCGHEADYPTVEHLDAPIDESKLTGATAELVKLLRSVCLTIVWQPRRNGRYASFIVKG